MRLIIRNKAEEAALYTCQYIVRRIKSFAPTAQRPFVIGLPTGSTPLPVYKGLVEMYKKGEISFKHVHTFNMDEYVGIDTNHPQSYHTFMFENFFNHVDIPHDQINILDGTAADLLTECRRYEEKIKAMGGIELFLGGIGEDGHIAFNEPGSSLASRTRVKTLAMDTIEANARFFDNDISKVPTMALTVGVATVLEAREIIIIITGRRKAAALAQAVEGGICHLVTVSAIQLHPWALVVCDHHATFELRVKTVDYFKSIEKVQEDVESYHANLAGGKSNGQSLPSSPISGSSMKSFAGVGMSVVNGTH